jgi:hypothetical protein
MQMSQFKQWIASWLDLLQRSLIKDPFRHLSRAELIEYLVNLEQRYKSTTDDINPQIFRLLDDVEAMYHGDLSVRTYITHENFLDFAITGAIHDALNLFLDNLCQLLAELPEDSPLRQKYKIAEQFPPRNMVLRIYPEMQQPVDDAGNR